MGKLWTGPTGENLLFFKAYFNNKPRYTFMYLAMGSIAVGVFFQSLFHVFVKEDNLNCCEEEIDVTVSGESVKSVLL